MGGNGHAERRGQCVICGAYTRWIDVDAGAYCCIGLCWMIYFEEHGTDAF